MRLQLRDMEYFAAIAEHGQVQLAATALGLSQPALSKSLRRLEQTTNAKLLKRTPKGVELTAVGAALLARVRKLKLSVDDISREVADLSEGRAGHLRIGASPVLALSLVAEACDRLWQESPNVALKVTSDARRSMLADLRNGELDFAVTTIPAPHGGDFADAHLLDDHFVVYAAAHVRLAKRRDLTLADLQHEQWALAAMDGPAERRLSQAFSDAGLPPPRFAFETPYLPLRNRLIATSNLLAFGSREAARQAADQYRIAILPVKDLVYVRRIGLIFRQIPYLSPAAQRFIEILKSTAKQIEKDNR